MAFTRIKYVNGRAYLYEETRWREGGKVKSRSRSLGPMDGGKKKRRGGFGVAFAVPFTILAHLARKSADKTYGRKWGQGKSRPDARSKERQDAHDRERWFQTRSKEVDRLNAERELYRTQHSADIRERSYHAGRASPEHAAREKLAALREEAETELAAAPQAPTKNFAVDDAIEAREAAFERVVEEYTATQNAADAGQEQPSAPAGDAAPESSS